MGVLRAYREAGISPSAISGTSAGALVGALVADGRTPAEAFALVMEELKRPRFSRRPTAASKRIEAFLRKNLQHQRFEELPIPFHVSATNLEKGGQHIFSSGELLPALMASCAIPVVFPPVKVDGAYFVDGGVSNNLPVEPFLAIKAQVIAVHVNPLPVFDANKRGMTRTMDRIWHLNFREMVMRSAIGCGTFVEPPGLSAFNMFEMSKAERIEQIGYDWVKKLLSDGH